MKSNVSVSEGQNHFPVLVKMAEMGQVVTVTRKGQSVACIIGYRRMHAIIETLEILANPAAMKATAEHQAGNTKFGRLN